MDIRLFLKQTLRVFTLVAAIRVPVPSRWRNSQRQRGSVRCDIAVKVERRVEAHPLQPVLTSMPGVVVSAAARLLTEVSGKVFATADRLAAYADFAPVTGRLGSSIRGKHPSRRGNKILKPALFLSAFAALRGPVSRAYYDRKVTQGRRHNQALIALTRRLCDVLYAMLRDGTHCQSRPSTRRLTRNIGPRPTGKSKRLNTPATTTPEPKHLHSGSNTTSLNVPTPASEQHRSAACRQRHDSVQQVDFCRPERRGDHHDEAGYDEEDVDAGGSVLPDEQAWVEAVCSIDATA